MSIPDPNPTETALVDALDRRRALAAEAAYQALLRLDAPPVAPPAEPVAPHQRPSKRPRWRRLPLPEIWHCRPHKGAA